MPPLEEKWGQRSMEESDSKTVIEEAKHKDWVHSFWQTQQGKSPPWKLQYSLITIKIIKKARFEIICTS